MPPLDYRHKTHTLAPAVAAFQARLVLRHTRQSQYGVLFGLVARFARHSLQSHIVG